MLNPHTVGTQARTHTRFIKFMQKIFLKPFLKRQVTSKTQHVIKCTMKLYRKLQYKVTRQL